MTAYSDMSKSVERLQRSRRVPEVYGFEGDTLDSLQKALAATEGYPKRVLLVRLGLKEDGSPEAWLQVKSEDKTAYTGNISFTCPPRPEEDCAN